MTLISIILPTFNGEKYITKTIESCLSQSYRNLELIIVDDHSTDNTLAVAEKFANKDSRVKIISNPENYQLPRSLNTGFASAAGELFTWISDDNYFAPHALETMAWQLEDNRGVDIVYSSYQFVDENGKILESFGGVIEKLIFKCITGACFLYRRQVHEELNGYSESKFGAEDMDFWLRAAARFRFKFIDLKGLYYYRKHQESLTFGIYKNDDLYKKYRQDYIHSFQSFFNEGLKAGFSEADLKLHMELFFDQLHRQDSAEFNLADKVLACLDHLDKLRMLKWERVYFDKHNIDEVLRAKRNGIVSLVINDLVFDNKRLEKKNPAIASQLNRPISWYYREYEVLPSWYKRLGHIIKIAQGNKPFRSVFIKKNLK